MTKGAYAVLGFEMIGDETFKQLVLARVVEPTSETDTLRVWAELDVPDRPPLSPSGACSRAAPMPGTIAWAVRVCARDPSRRAGGAVLRAITFWLKWFGDTP